MASVAMMTATLNQLLPTAFFVTGAYSGPGTRGLSQFKIFFLLPNPVKIEEVLFLLMRLAQNLPQRYRQIIQARLDGKWQVCAFSFILL